MKKLRKSLAVLLAIIMLASFTPLFASAATITLNTSNVIILEAPKITYGDQVEVSKITVDYGVRVKDLTVTGGKLGYIASEGATPVEIPGTFTGTYALKLAVGEDTTIPIKFTPDDTTTYSSPTIRNTYTMADGVVWPSAKVIAIATTLVEKPVPAAATIAINTYLSNSAALSGGKVTDADGNEVSGTWSYVNNRVMDTEGTFEEEIQWKKTGYDTIKSTVTITVKEYKTTLAEAPTMSALTLAGSFLNNAQDSKISGGKVIDEDGNEVTGGTWKVAYPTAQYLYCDTTVKATWTKTGYQTITTDVVIPVTQAHETYTFEKAASLEVSGQTLTYAPELTWESLKINEAIIKDKNGNLVEGKYTLNYLESPTALYTGRVGVYTSTVHVNICFTPNDTSLPVYYFKDRIAKVNKADFTITADSELVFNYGTAYETSYDDNDLRFSTIKTIPEEAASQGIEYVKWASADVFDPATADYGSVTMVEVTIIPKHGSYNNATVTIPVRIQPYTMSGRFTSESQNGVSEAVAFMYGDDKDDGLITYLLDFTNKRLKGSVAITATDGTNTYDIATVTPDENNRFYVEDKWQAPADGNYVFTFTYTASEDDTAAFSSEKLKVITNVEGVDVDMKEFRTVTVKIGSTVYTEEVRESHIFTKLWSDLTTADKSVLDHWLITDENGNEITVKDSVGRDFDITDSVISIKVPEHDITITAISASGEAVDENATGGSLWSFWQKLVDWLVSLYRTIVELLIPTVETF